MKYTFVFYTHAGAIKFKKECEKLKIDCDLMPVPRKLSSNCGIGAQVITEKYEILISDDVEKVFCGEVSNPKLVYENEL
jgi:hypothetical protein